ncbi:MAG: hypothetical protein ACK4PI_14570 [Tepidisphaerales bacterium]
MRPRSAIVLTLLLLGLYALWAGSAVSTLSPTVDERLHAVGGWWAVHHGDFRVNREDPPLFLYLAGVTTAIDDVELVHPERWSGGALGSAADLDMTRERDPVGLVHAARRPFFLLSLLLGAALAAFAAHVAAAVHPATSAAPVAAVAAAAAFALEPLLLGHGILVKNDVPFALATLLTLWSLWRLTVTGSALALIALAAAATFAVTVKFSGLLLLLGALPATLLLRALTSKPWQLAGLPLPTRRRRLAAAAAAYLVVLATAYAGVWAAYQFRFAPTRDPDAGRFDIPGLVARANRMAAVAELARTSPTVDVTLDEAALAAAAQRPPPAFVRAVVFAHTHRLLPESMCAGLIFTYASTLARPAFLLGRYSDVGFPWVYFPLAYLFKTPLTTLALLTAAALSLALRPRRWADYAFLLVPAAVLAAAILPSRLNIGLRHLSPLYPVFLTAIALFVAHLWHTTPRRLHLPLSVLALLLLAAEVLPHRLQYIQFFNLAAGGPAGGLHLLSDSNLDWGQDLYRLVAWQRDHPRERLFFIYFGSTDLAAAGLRAINAPGSWAGGPQRAPTPGSVLAISASHLQGTYYREPLRSDVVAWQRRTPLAVLGGTIYLYRVPAPPEPPPTTP